MTTDAGTADAGAWANALPAVRAANPASAIQLPLVMVSSSLGRKLASSPTLSRRTFRPRCSIARSPGRPPPLTPHRPARPIPAKPSRSVAHEHCRCLVRRRQSRSGGTRAGPGSRPRGGGRRDRAHAGDPRAAAEPAARGAAVPHAAAALGRRRPGRALDLLRAIEEIARFDGSVGWNIFVGNSAALIAPYIPIEAARTIFGDPRGLIAWGPPNQHRADRRPGRLPGHRRMAFRLGLAAGQLDRRALPRRRAGRLAAAEPLRPADRAHPADAQGQEHADPRLEHARHARHGVGRLFDQGRVRAGGVLRHARGPDLAARPRAALCLHHPEPLCGRRRRRGAGHRPRDARGLHGR